MKGNWRGDPHEPLGKKIPPTVRKGMRISATFHRAQIAGMIERKGRLKDKKKE